MRLFPAGARTQTEILLWNFENIANCPASIQKTKGIYTDKNYAQRMRTLWVITVSNDQLVPNRASQRKAGS